MFAGGDHTIVATGAGADHFSVINYQDWRPGCVVVTGLATITAINMRGRLTCGSSTVVTIETGLSDDSAVVEGDIPVGGRVTRIACLSGNNVRGMFAGGDYTVVTTFTTADHLKVINAGNGGPV